MRNIPSVTPRALHTVRCAQPRPRFARVQCEPHAGRSTRRLQCEPRMRTPYVSPIHGAARSHTVIAPLKQFSEAGRRCLEYGNQIKREGAVQCGPQSHQHCDGLTLRCAKSRLKPSVSISALWEAETGAMKHESGYPDIRSTPKLNSTRVWVHPVNLTLSTPE